MSLEDEHPPLADAIVCGAGTAGLAGAAPLQGAGLEVTVLEQTDKGRCGLANPV